MAETKRSETKYLDKINEVAATFTSPFTRDIFIEMADQAYNAAKAKYSATYVAKKISAEEIPTLLEHDPEYGMHMTGAISGVEKLVRKIETTLESAKTDTSSLDKRIKDLKKREDALKKNEKTYELNLAGIEQREAMMKQIGDKYGNIAAYEMKLGEREIELKKQAAQYVDLKMKHAELDERVKSFAEKAQEVETGKSILEQGYKDLDEREKALTAREERAKDLIPHAINAAKSEIHDSLGEILKRMEAHETALGAQKGAIADDIKVIRGFYNEYKPESLAQAPEIKADTSVRQAPQNNA